MTLCEQIFIMEGGGGGDPGDGIRGMGEGIRGMGEGIQRGGGLVFSFSHIKGLKRKGAWGHLHLSPALLGGIEYVECSTGME